MKSYFCWLLVPLVALMGATGLQAATDLEPDETFLRSTFRSDGEPRAYLRVGRQQPASFSFCGAGKLQILSRAVLESGAAAARYSLAIEIDGQRQSVRFDHRVTRVDSGSFDGSAEAGALRRAPFDLGRGCHTVEVAVTYSTEPVVGIRASFSEKRPTRRSWQPAIIRGGREVELAVGDERAIYRRLTADQPLVLNLAGPAWVRLLVRPLGSGEVVSHDLTVRRDGESYRRYRLRSEPSRSSSLVGDAYVTVGRANEVVLAVGEGRQELEILAPVAQGALVRAQIAERTTSVTEVATEVASEWRVRARLASYYDDNILRYSDKFIARFDAGRDPDRFRVDSLDDVIHRADVYLDRSFSGLAGRPAGVGFDLEHRAYQRNGIKDWSRLGISWDQELPGQRELTLALTYTPDFYVRHLRDSDLTGAGQQVDPFQAFEFEKSEARAALTQPIGASFRGRFHLGYSRFEHSAAFQEFDSDNLFAGARIDHDFDRRWRFSYAVELTESSAQGFDEPGETRRTSDDTDPSYRQLDLMLAARYRFATARRQTLFLQGELGQRDYTTDKGSRLAPLHAGRDDELLRFFASWQLELNQRYDLIVFGQLRDRSSEAPVRLDIGVEKDYSQFEAGVRLSARFGG
ncbi:MAG: hypothetical protein AAF604_11425 [Acidobacteriota bacterium]